MKVYISASAEPDVRLVQTYEREEESYTTYCFDITADGMKVGDCSMMVDENSAYCERIDIDGNHRNKGYGTAALQELSSMYGEIIVAPDNADAQRLYERLGYEYNGEDADYIDQGYGVYSI